ncbi:hypothetical protein [Bacteroides reticulotermitis]|uniref:Virulence protein n=1 Tax=Bacteroides reticulotermitis TaxID=1133319 RepID=A0A840D6V0_9BACE|nr:hypothetical protein [Bacteroides reticulotermitis]MBB4046188.1 hypothetical protein [Bacteroides reticulotermitis]
MKRDLKIGDSQIITIGNGMVSVPQFGEVRMTAFEIAALFEVYTQTINAHIKAVLKSGVIKTDISRSVTVTGNILMPEVYGLDMIIALAFRVNSLNAELFRKYVIRRITANPLPQKLIIQLSNRALYN